MALQNPIIVNLKNSSCDLYIGRPSIWGNPYSHLLTKNMSKWYVKTREEAIEKYREYLLTNQDLLDRLHEIDGKILGCWCSPLPCHGEILIEERNKQLGTR